ncbi:MAG: hypothetical protein HY319_23135 [Armatimonadetes bacterium]|nr:hypothetical protein [Armatimonadota bacterium]
MEGRLREGLRFEIAAEGPVTHVRCSVPELGFTLTAHPDGGAVLDGHYAFKDFTLTPSDGGLVVQGHYPHQRYRITPP